MEWRLDCIAKVVAPIPANVFDRIVFVGINGRTSFKYCPWLIVISTVFIIVLLFIRF